MIYTFDIPNQFNAICIKLPLRFICSCQSFSHDITNHLMFSNPSSFIQNSFNACSILVNITYNSNLFNLLCIHFHNNPGFIRTYINKTINPGLIQYALYFKDYIDQNPNIIVCGDFNKLSLTLLYDCKTNFLNNLLEYLLHTLKKNSYYNQLLYNTINQYIQVTHIPLSVKNDIYTSFMEKDIVLDSFLKRQPRQIVCTDNREWYLSCFGSLNNTGTFGSLDIVIFKIKNYFISFEKYNNISNIIKFKDVPNLFFQYKNIDNINNIHLLLTNNPKENIQLSNLYEVIKKNIFSYSPFCRNNINPSDIIFSSDHIPIYFYINKIIPSISDLSISFKDKTSIHPPKTPTKSPIIKRRTLKNPLLDHLYIELLKNPLLNHLYIELLKNHHINHLYINPLKNLPQNHLSNIYLQKKN